MPAKYNTATIRNLLKEALSDVELVTLCYDHFRPVYNNFAPDMGFLWKIQILIEYCEKYLEFDRLLDLVGKANPVRYDQFRPLLQAPAQVPAQVPGRATGSDKASMKINWPVDLDSFTPEQQATVIRAAIGAIAGILDIPRESIELKEFQIGSLTLRVSMPKEAADRLMAQHAMGDPVVQDLGIQEISIISEESPPAESAPEEPIPARPASVDTSPAESGPREPTPVQPDSEEPSRPQRNLLGWGILAVVLLLILCIVLLIIRWPRPPEIEIWLASGCNETYLPGDCAMIRVRSNTDGVFEVHSVDPLGRRTSLFENEIQAEQISSLDWRIPESGGIWALEATLAGTEAKDRCIFSVEAGSQSYSVLYDFVQEARNAIWSVYTPYPYPLGWADTAKRSLGFVQLQNFVLENGEQGCRVLETNPPWTAGGEIWGEYDLAPIVFREGDRFVAQIGFPEGSTLGDVTFKIHLRSGEPGSQVITLSSLSDEYDGELKSWEILLPRDMDCRYFGLEVDAGPVALQDRALWIKAQIERPLQ